MSSYSNAGNNVQSVQRKQNQDFRYVFFVRAVGQRVGGGVGQFEGETSVEIVKTISNFTQHCLWAINIQTQTDRHTHRHGHSLGPHDIVVWVALCWVSELSGYDHLSNTALRREGE